MHSNATGVKELSDVDGRVQNMTKLNFQGKGIAAFVNLGNLRRTGKKLAGCQGICMHGFQPKTRAVFEQNIFMQFFFRTVITEANVKSFFVKQ
jgi:hypothetical protein